MKSFRIKQIKKKMYSNSGETTAYRTTAAGLVQKRVVFPPVGSDRGCVTSSPQTNSIVGSIAYRELLEEVVAVW